MMTQADHETARQLGQHIGRPEIAAVEDWRKILFIGEIENLGPHIAAQRAAVVMQSSVEAVSYTHLDVYKRQLNITRMSMGLKGYVADGLLFRVSEVAEDAKLSNLLLNQFINDLLRALTPAQQTMLIGQPKT